LVCFLRGPRNPEYFRAADAEDEIPAVNTGREWSNAELNELGDMLLCGLRMEEIALRLRRAKIEVQDKVAEIGRACRGVAAE
jgi:hypothetical protein